MNQQERNIVLGVLLSVAVLVGVDLLTDFKEGVVLWHILTEAGIGTLALAGVFYLIRGTFFLRRKLQDAESWKAQSRKYIEGLSRAIDDQLTQWELTTAEKEVAFLLLKGLSLKEIAEVRNTTEKTARTQSIAIYAKSKLAGRSELSAFFLEDLLTYPLHPK